MELDGREKRFLALAIYGLVMRQGSFYFPMAVSVAEKLGIRDYLVGCFSSWIARCEDRGDRPDLPAERFRRGVSEQRFRWKQFMRKGEGDEDS